MQVTLLSLLPGRLIPAVPTANMVQGIAVSNLMWDSHEQLCNAGSLNQRPVPYGLLCKHLEMAYATASNTIATPADMAASVQNLVLQTVSDDLLSTTGTGVQVQCKNVAVWNCEALPLGGLMDACVDARRTAHSLSCTGSSWDPSWTTPCKNTDDWYLQTGSTLSDISTLQGMRPTHSMYTSN